MTRLTATLAGLVVSALVGIGSVGAGMFDLRSDWSDIANPNGVWAYREGLIPLPHQAKLDSSAGLGPGPQPGWGPSDGTTSPWMPIWFKSVYDHPVIAKGADQATADWLIGDIVTHSQDNGSGPGEGVSNVTFTNPSACIADISGGVWMARDIGRRVDWALYLNSNLLTSGSVYSGDPHSRSQPFDLASGSGGGSVLNDVPLQAGDVLKLQLTTNGSKGDYVGVNLTIQTTPEPSALALFIAGCLGLGAYAWRRSRRRK